MANPYGAPPPNPYGPPPPNPYGAPPPNPYGAPPAASPYGAPPTASPYGAPPAANPYGAPPANPYGAPAPSAPYAPKPGKEQGGFYGGAADPYAAKPGKEQGGFYGGAADPYASKPGKEHKAQGGYGGGPAGISPFSALVPSQFPPGTDPNLMACFHAADQDGSGLIDDKELQRALSSYNQSFSIRTVRLLMYLFTGTNVYKIGPKEFTSVFYSLQNWRANFERFDRDRSGRIDANELRDALLSLGFSVTPMVLDLLVSKFDRTGGASKSIEYDNFIECCLTVKGLTEKFKERDTSYTGTATFSYETFMLTVLPFLIA